MKRVLIITYYWPPAGGPGVQRWLKFVRYLRDFQIEPVVYVPNNPHYPILDEGLLKEVPEDIEILRMNIKEPYRLARIFSRKKTEKLSSGLISGRKPGLMERLMLYIRGNFFIPDARVGWVNPSVDYLTDYISQNPVAAVITSGPPHSLHLIGQALKAELNLPWLADFRDPWTSIHYHNALRLGKRAREKHLELEKKVLTEADHIVVTSPSTQTEFEGITSRPITVITNGYDESTQVPPSAPDEKFSLVHIGSLLGERNPLVLWQVLSELCEENPEFRSDLELKLVGVVSEQVMASLEEYGLIKQCNSLGYVEHSEALRLQKAAQILLLIEMNRKETRAIIPGKLYEYLLAKRPILALGPLGSDIDRIIRETSSGLFFHYGDYERLKGQITGWYRDYRKGSLTLDSEGLERYSRKELSRKMAGLLHDL